MLVIVRDDFDCQTVGAGRSLKFKLLIAFNIFCK